MTSGANRSVVVGIDGSEQAEDASAWAVDEALRRGACLRLVYVIRTDLTGPLTADEYRSALDDAKEALHSARAAIGRTGRSVEVHTSIAQGSPSGVLLAESADAELICLGASGMGRIGRVILGSTAAAVAERAECAVMIAPAPHACADRAENWVIVPVNVYTEYGSDVVEDAIAEARLRNWPVLAVGVRHPRLGATPYDAVDDIVSEWQCRFPDVHVYPVATDAGLRSFLHDNPDVGGLVVVDSVSAADVAAIVGSEHSGRAPVAERAVLVVHRQRSSSQLAEADSARC
jgi:nucleotide-binding universal stress UspA family protein